MAQPATNANPVAARALLESAYKELLAASKIAVSADGATLLAAAAAVDVAVECLTPGTPDITWARASCTEALELARKTQSYAQGGNIANVLDPARQRLTEALKLLPLP